MSIFTTILQRAKLPDKCAVSSVPRFGMRGFTLLEMIVVLVIIAMIAGIAVPNFSRMLDSYTASTKWAELLSEVDGLPYRAYTTGQPLRLSEASAPQLLSTLPADWKINIEGINESVNPSGGPGNRSASIAISYRENGWCGGGRVTFITDAGARRTVDLVAPRCAVSAS